VALNETKEKQSPVEKGQVVPLEKPHQKDVVFNVF